MTQKISIRASVVLDEDAEFSLEELCRACEVERAVLVEMVEGGLLEPIDFRLAPWRFRGPALRRARTALRLQRDLEVNLAGAALILDLLEDIERLEARLRRNEP